MVVSPIQAYLDLYARGGRDLKQAEYLLDNCNSAEVEDRVIPEPQKTYVLELLQALGPTADEFVVAGAQAMKFMVDRARATKDIDFVLDVVKLRGSRYPSAPNWKNSDIKWSNALAISSLKNQSPTAAKLCESNSWRPRS